MAEITFNFYAVGGAEIPAGQTLDLDTLDFSTFSTIDYILSFKNSDETLTKSLRLFARKSALGNVEESVSARLGALALEISTAVEGSTLKLKVKNNELFTINASFARAGL